MSAHDPNLDIFAQRVKRIRACAPNTSSTLYVGMDLTFDKAAVRKRVAPKRKGRGWLYLALLAPLLGWVTISMRDSGVSIAGFATDPVTSGLIVMRTLAAMVGLQGVV